MSMNNQSAIAIAHPNIAFIKYWGNRDDALRIPVNGSISMNLASLVTRTRVSVNNSLSSDHILIGGRKVDQSSSARISTFLDIIRKRAGSNSYADVETMNNFPSGSGIASSASGFAALALAGTHAYGLELDEAGLSRLARRGSGSACRSIPTGFVEWHQGVSDDDSYANSIAPPDHWPLVDLVVIVDPAPKHIGSTEGHHLASTSPLQAARVADTPRRLDLCRRGILDRDFETFASLVEQDCLMMHAVMMTSRPPLLYWKPATLEVMHLITSLRRSGKPVCFTIDAGANVHVLTTVDHQTSVLSELQNIPSIQSILISTPGTGAQLVEAD